MSKPFLITQDGEQIAATKIRSAAQSDFDAKQLATRIFRQAENVRETSEAATEILMSLARANVERDPVVVAALIRHASVEVQHALRMAINFSDLIAPQRKPRRERKPS